MNKYFVTGFVKRAQSKGLTNLHALEILKEAGLGDWLSDRATNFYDAARLGALHVFNNDITHAGASLLGNPFTSDYWNNFGKRFDASEAGFRTDIGNVHTDVANHGAQQGDFDKYKKYSDLAYNDAMHLHDPKSIEGIGSRLNKIHSYWDSKQSNDYNTNKIKLDAENKAKDSLSYSHNNRQFTPIGQAPEMNMPPAPLTTNPPPNTQASNSGLLGANTGMPDLRESFTADTNLRKPLGGYK